MNGMSLTAVTSAVNHFFSFRGLPCPREPEFDVFTDVDGRKQKKSGLPFGKPPCLAMIYLAMYAAAFCAAIRPKITISATALPPRRFAPCTPPVTSPAAYRPGMT